MQLRRIPGIKWPPDWGRPYARGEKFEIGEDGGTLAGAKLKHDHIELSADFNGKQPRDVVRHKDIELLKRIEEVLRTHVGRPLREVGDSEVPDK